MPETTYLHIQGRETDPTRVLELPAAGVRVGRGARCEVRLPDPSLSEVQCIVRPRGDSWHVQPVGAAGSVSIEGEAVRHLHALPLGVPLQVGSYRLVLRPSAWGSYQAPIEVGPGLATGRPVEPREVVDSGRPAPDRPAPRSNTEAEAERLGRWQARLEQRERLLGDRLAEKKWEARWKAAGEGLRARSGSPVPPRASPPPSATPGPPPRPEVSRPPTPVRPPTPSIAKAPTSQPREPRPVSAPIPPESPFDAPPPDPVPLGLPAPETPRLVGPPDDREVVTGGDGADQAEMSATAVGVETPTDEVEVSPDVTIGADVEPSADELKTDDAAQDAPEESATPIVGLWRHAVETDAPPEPAPGPPPIPKRKSPSPRPVPTPATSTARAEFPSVRTILAAQGTRAVAEPTTRRRARRGPEPTAAREPGHWSLPAWLGAIPALLAGVGVVGAGVFLGVVWTGDNLAVGPAARAALRSSGGAAVPLDPSIRPETRWWKSTAGHMALWAAAVERSPEGPDRAGEVRDLLDAAGRAAPLRREVRYALAGEDRPEFSAVGLSRDVASLTLTGRALKRSGKVGPALAAFRRALELASGADPARLEPPTFDEDSGVRRYRLPHEALAAGVVREIMGAKDWGFPEWSAALPPVAVARLAAARLLREAGSPDAAKAIDLVLSDEVPEPDRPGLVAEHLAAQAEALAFRDRRTEAAGRYRRAIETADDDATRRRWRLSLFEILATLGASEERARLLEAAKGTDPDEEVTRKAIDAQKFAGLR